MMCCCCASCGVAEVDNCDLVRYCSDTCQQIESSVKVWCNGKERAVELRLRDELLFRQTESSYGDNSFQLDQINRHFNHSAAKWYLCIGCKGADTMWNSDGREWGVGQAWCIWFEPRFVGGFRFGVLVGGNFQEIAYVFFHLRRKTRHSAFYFTHHRDTTARWLCLKSQVEDDLLTSNFLD